MWRLDLPKMDPRLSSMAMQSGIVKNGTLKTQGGHRGLERPEVCRDMAAGLG